MKQLFKLLILIFLVSNATLVDAQERENKTVFWFNIKITNVLSGTKAKEYVMRPISKKIYSGTQENFRYNLWKGCAAGTMIAIGPYSSREDANYALQIYYAKADSLLPVGGSSNYSWFLAKVNILTRSRSYQFERMAAAVSSGNTNEFYDLLHESLKFQKLAIGPFRDVLDAELAKQIYRLEE